MLLDYIIVGFGLSGANLAFGLEESGKDFMVFEDNFQNSSQVAGGLMNPVILKRFTMAWKAGDQLPEAVLRYRKLEKHLEVKIIRPLRVYRKFSSVEEQNNWFTAADKPLLSPFLDTQLVRDLNKNVPSKFSFGRVLNTYQVDTALFLSAYKKNLLRKKKMDFSRFDYHELRLFDDFVEYKNIKAKKVVFCEGFGLKKNPFFNYLPLVGNKGEYLVIGSEALQLKAAVKSAVFVIPVGEHLYKVGATYNNSDKSMGPTLEAREKLVEELDSLITCEYDVVDHITGIRPSTADRRPLAGRHPKYSNLYCCNGFGSRGVMMAPDIADHLLDFIENSEALPPEIDISRFKKKWFSPSRLLGY